jgi:competence protein ComEC
LLVAAWLVGVLLGFRLEVPWLPVLLLVLAVLPAGLLLHAHRCTLWPVALCGVLLLGLLRVEAGGAQPAAPVTADRPAVTLVGQIVDDPEPAGQLIKFTVAVRTIDLGNGPEPAKSKVQVFASDPRSLAEFRDSPYFRYGDEVTLRGDLARPQAAKSFDYPAYLANLGISGTFWARDAELVSRTSSPSLAKWRGWVFDLRRELSENIEDALPYPQSALAQALLLGQVAQLPDSLVEDFRATGTAHLLAISGMQVAVVLVMSVAAAGWWLGRRRQLYLLLPLAAIWLYALVSGMEPSVVRAAVMGSVYLAALALGRPRSVLPALAFSAALMVAAAPVVLYRPSFQLSFVAMAGVALAMPYQARIAAAVAGRFESAGEWWRPWLSRLLSIIAIALFVSLAATLATWPLVSFTFHQFPLTGIFVTALALPVQPFILLGSLAAAAAGIVHPAIGQLFGWITWVPLSYMEELVSTAPSHVISGDWVGAPLVWAWYVILGGVVLFAGGPARLGNLAARLRALAPRLAPGELGGVRPTSRNLWSGGITLLLVSAAVLVWAQVFGGPDGKLHVYFFDVGQGDSALVVTPSGRQVLVDGGPETESAIRALAGPMSAGDRSLDLVVLTHLDADHSRGLLEVLDRYRVAAVLLGVSDPDSAIYALWRASMDRNGLAETPVHAGYRVMLEPGVVLEVLNPPKKPIGGSAADENNNGVVLRLSHGDVSFLLVADIAAAAESYLVRDASPLESEVLKVAHHGSKTSTTAPFLRRVRPVVAVVSVGEGNRYGHPHQEVINRLEEAVGLEWLYRTDRDGTIEFISDGQSLWARTER